MKNNKVSFNDIEVGQRFMFMFMFYEKKSSVEATLLSDEKFEQERAKFIPNRGLVQGFGAKNQVEPVDEPLLIDQFSKGWNTNWPADKHPG